MGHRVTPEQYAKRAPRRASTARGSTASSSTTTRSSPFPRPARPPKGIARARAIATFCSLWTQAAMPAVTLPIGFGPRHLPLGLQLVGRYREDEHALKVASWVEATLGFHPGLAGD